MNSEPFIGKYWSQQSDGRILCELCPRECVLAEGQRGFCFVRQNLNNQMVLTTYGRSSGFCVDPIEKKPLNHFYPGSSVLSFGTAGCNLGCKFCQNWDISKSREWDRLTDQAGPEKIARVAQQLNCKSVAFTYNDPVIFAEYAIDVASACHTLDIKTVAVTAGYISARARQEFFAHIDAVNVDLKAFTKEFYRKVTLAELEPVLDTLQYIRHQTNVWLEITTLLIPGENDSPAEIDAMSKWIVQHLGPDVPHHFTAFHPDYKMRDKSRTPYETLAQAQEIARGNGIKYVYTGNVHNVDGSSTYCSKCGDRLIERDWYVLGAYKLVDANKCPRCRCTLPGHFDVKPGQWGSRRLPVDIRQY